jgi:adenine-specific DNA-methyltransferase
MSELLFKGKEFVFNHHLSVPYRPLEAHADKGIAVKGEAPKLDGNLVVHGDNLHALKALMPMYAGKVDCIFIDPPYNTGNEGWAYSDNVNSPYINEWLSSNPINKEDLLRHDKWLCMMWPRLRLLHELLADTGLIFICIGDDEQHRVRFLLDEIFGEELFVGCFVWQSRAKPSNIGEAKFKPQNDAEYIFVYEKTKSASAFSLILSGDDRAYPHADQDGKYRLQTILKSNRGENQRDTMRFSINEYTPPIEQRWQGGEKLIQSLFDSNRMEFREGIPFRKYYETEESAEHAPFYCFIDKCQSGTAESGKQMLNKIMGGQHGMDTVKPLEVIRYLLSRCTDKNSIVLDSFAGSGTTAHAVLALNAEDEGDRKFILVEGEDYADTLTAERVRRVMNGYTFTGKQRTELLREPINYTALKKADKLLDKIAAIENLHGHEFDCIKKTVKDDTLVVTGERDIEEKTAGLGGMFTYCTLGEAVDLQALLSGKDKNGNPYLPTFEQFGAWAFSTATSQAFSPATADASTFYLGESAAFHVWLYYKPDLDWLKSKDSALTLEKAEALHAAMPLVGTGKRHLVYAPAKFVPNRALQPLAVEYAPLPFALFKIDR